MERKTRPQDSGGMLSTTLAAAVSSLLFVHTADLAADTNVYRCTMPNGAIEFSQHPCAEGASEQEISIPDRKTGWVPSNAPSRQTVEKTRKPRNRKRKAGGTDQAAAQVRREEQCWKKRQLAEEVSRKLRRGYKAGQGVKLRHRRRVYEEYIREFCS